MTNAIDTSVQPKSYFTTEKSLVSRLIESHSNPGTMMTAMHNMISIADSKARTFFDTKQNHVLSSGGIEVLRANTLTDAETKLKDIVDGELRPATDHLRQVEQELADVPALMHIELAREIRDELRKMSASERAARLRDTDDDETISAIVHGPRGMFALADDATLTRMIARYNAKHRPEKAAMAQTLRDRIEAVQNFRDMLLRRLKETLR
jgi:hypothetical protein